MGIAHKLPNLKTIVAIGSLHPEVKNILKFWSKQNNVRVFEMAERTSILFTTGESLKTPNS